jgi:capsular polysaccharide transport system permease protein
MDPVRARIRVLEEEIALLRAKLTEGEQGGQSLARIQGELLVAQADVQTRQLLLSQSLQAMENARIEANRQVRYLSVSVSPVAPDEASYPRAFENTAVAMLVFAGIYLMVSMTAAILREQVTA